MALPWDSLGSTGGAGPARGPVRSAPHLRAIRRHPLVLKYISKRFRNKVKFCRTCGDCLEPFTGNSPVPSGPPSRGPASRVGEQRVTGPSPRGRLRGPWPHLYLVLDVVPDPQHHDAEDGLRETQEGWVTALPHGGSGPGVLSPREAVPTTQCPLHPIRVPMRVPAPHSCPQGSPTHSTSSEAPSPGAARAP